MDIDEKFLKEFVKVTQQASIATLPKIGKKDKNRSAATEFSSSSQTRV